GKQSGAWCAIAQTPPWPRAHPEATLTKSGKSHVGNPCRHPVDPVGTGPGVVHLHGRVDPHSPGGGCGDYPGAGNSWPETLDCALPCLLSLLLPLIIGACRSHEWTKNCCHLVDCGRSTGTCLWWLQLYQGHPQCGSGSPANVRGRKGICQCSGMGRHRCHRRRRVAVGVAQEKLKATYSHQISAPSRVKMPAMEPPNTAGDTGRNNRCQQASALSNEEKNHDQQIANYECHSC